MKSKPVSKLVPHGIEFYRLVAALLTARGAKRRALLALIRGKKS